MRHAAALRAFRHRNFRLFFAGQGISIIGTWVQSIALSWLMYRLTGSPVLLGLTTFLTQALDTDLKKLAGIPGSNN